MTKTKSKNFLEIQDLEGCKLINRSAFKDERGTFCEMFREEDYEDMHFIQDNLSHSISKGTFRGLHFQSPPYSQSKLVSVLSGSIIDFFVDLRFESRTFLMHSSHILNADSYDSLLIPKGFAHGFLTLEDNTIVSYKVDNYFSSEHDNTLLWSDSKINLALDSGDIVHISNKDKHGLTIKELLSQGLINA